MNGYDYSKEYGRHKYDKGGGTSDCTFGCGTSMGQTSSHAKLIGVDPFGECPMNPGDGKAMGSSVDHAIVVERRIRFMAKRAYNAEVELALVSPSTRNLGRRVRALEERNQELRNRLRDITSIAWRGKTYAQCWAERTWPKKPIVKKQKKNRKKR